MHENYCAVHFWRYHRERRFVYPERSPPCIPPARRRLTHRERSSRANRINSPLAARRSGTRVRALINPRRAASYRRFDLRLASQCRVLIGADGRKKDVGVELRRTDVTARHDAIRISGPPHDFGKNAV